MKILIAMIIMLAATGAKADLGVYCTLKDSGFPPGTRRFISIDLNRYIVTDTNFGGEHPKWGKEILIQSTRQGDQVRYISAKNISDTHRMQMLIDDKAFEKVGYRFNASIHFADKQKNGHFKHSTVYFLCWSHGW